MSNYIFNINDFIASKSIDLSTTTTRSPKALKKKRKKIEKTTYECKQNLIDLQLKLYAGQSQKVLIVFQAIDAGGKDGTIRRVFSGMNPQGVQVSSFKKPTKKERQHDFLWRIHKQTPSNGMIKVFNRSHYEDVLVVRVDNLVKKEIWQSRYKQINDFESNLESAGTTIIKFFLHISKEEQKDRFQERLDIQEKNWKFDPNDLEKRKQWDQYQVAFQDMLRKCSTKKAPWYVIPSDQKWYRNYIISNIIRNRLEELNLTYPRSLDLSKIIIPD